MESLSLGLSSHPPSLNHTKTQTSISRSIIALSSLNQSNSFKIHSIFTNKLHLIPKKRLSNPQINNISTITRIRSISISRCYQTFLQTHLSFLVSGLMFPLSSFAIETPPLFIEDNKVNVEAIVVSIDDFFNKNPFFVGGVAFIYLVLVPLVEEYYSKYKFISAISAFQKLRDDQNSQLIDIRDKRSLAVLNSPNLKFINKSAVQVAFREGDEDGFLKEVLDRIQDPANTTICVLDNFDGASIKVAELLVKNGFKEAYAIRGGIRGKKGWQDIQESMLPPSVHIKKPKKKVKSRNPVGTDEDMNQQSVNQDQATSSRANGNIGNGYVNSSTQPNSKAKRNGRSSSPYPNYPDLKPPSSPTPSKP